MNTEANNPESNINTAAADPANEGEAVADSECKTEAVTDISCTMAAAIETESERSVTDPKSAEAVVTDKKSSETKLTAVTANAKKKAKKKRSAIGKINPVLHKILKVVLTLTYKRKYHITLDNEIAKDIKGPAIVVASHTSDQDHFLSALTLYPVRPTYIVSEHFVHNKSTAGLIKLGHVITKRMFIPDVSTIINVMRAKGEGAVIVIFPEGRLSCYGRTLPVADGTAELIKKLGVDLYHWHADGAYLTFPKWRDKGDDRIGEIRCSLKKLATAEEIGRMSIDEIRTVTEEAIAHDDELAMAGVSYKSKNIARGVDKILFKCPKCLSEGKIESEGDRIRCSGCGFEARLDDKYRLHDAPHGSINEWFEWQQESIDTDNEIMESKVGLGACGDDGMMDRDAGEGEIYMDKDVFRLRGTLFGEEIDFEAATEKLGAFPITAGDHFDVYHNGRLIYVYPRPDMRASVKWVCFLDRLMQKKGREG